MDAIQGCTQPHLHSLSVTKGGHSAIVSTNGNEDCHIILRGGKAANDAASVDVARISPSSGLASRTVIHDASHAAQFEEAGKPNSCVRRYRRGLQQRRRIVSIMVSRILIAGRQDLVPGKELWKASR